jgi:GST-like protein
MADPIQLYFWPTPNGLKINIALREMDLPYEIVPVNIGAGDQFKPEFLAISPNNRMPAIVDPDGPGGQPVSVFESGAILQYLARKSGKFYGADDRTRIAADEWLFWQVGGLGPMAGQANHFRVYAPATNPDQRLFAYGNNRYSNELHRLYGVMETRLRDREHLAGDYSIADMACWPWVINPAARGIDLTEFPNVSAWAERIGAREAVKAAVAEGETTRKAGVSLGDNSKAAEDQRKLLFGQRARRD